MGEGESRLETEADLIGLRLIPGNLENDSDCKLCGTARLRIACRNSKTGRLNHRCNLPEGGIAEVTVRLGEVCVNTRPHPGPLPQERVTANGPQELSKRPVRSQTNSKTEHHFIL